VLKVQTLNSTTSNVWSTTSVTVSSSSCCTHQVYSTQ